MPRFVPARIEKIFREAGATRVSADAIDSNLIKELHEIL